MTDRNRTIINSDWIQNLVVVLTLLGTGIGVYVNTVNRVTAAEQKIAVLERDIEDYKGVPAALARIEEQITGTRRDIARIETKIK